MQNATERVSRTGPGAEALRRIHIQRLRSHLDAFYEHGSLADILLLSAAFEEAERRYRAAQMWDRACLVESLLTVSGFLHRQDDLMSVRDTLNSCPRVPDRCT